MKKRGKYGNFSQVFILIASLNNFRYCQFVCVLKWALVSIPICIQNYSKCPNHKNPKAGIKRREGGLGGQGGQGQGAFEEGEVSVTVERGQGQADEMAGAGQRRLQGQMR